MTLIPALIYPHHRHHCLQSLLALDASGRPTALAALQSPYLQQWPADHRFPGAVTHDDALHQRIDTLDPPEPAPAIAAPAAAHGPRALDGSCGCGGADGCAPSLEWSTGAASANAQCWHTRQPAAMAHATQPRTHGSGPALEPGSSSSSSSHVGSHRHLHHLHHSHHDDHHDADDDVDDDSSSTYNEPEIRVPEIDSEGVEFAPVDSDLLRKSDDWPFDSDGSHDDDDDDDDGDDDGGGEEEEEEGEVGDGGGSRGRGRWRDDDDTTKESESSSDGDDDNSSGGKRAARQRQRRRQRGVREGQLQLRLQSSP